MKRLITVTILGLMCIAADCDDETPIVLEQNTTAPANNTIPANNIATNNASNIETPTSSNNNTTTPEETTPQDMSCVLSSQCGPDQICNGEGMCEDYDSTEPITCLEEIDLMGIGNRGAFAVDESCYVTEPMISEGPINGIRWLYYGDKNRPEDSPALIRADCTLIKSLAFASNVFRQFDVTHVYHVGAYDCAHGGEHASGMAIDIGGFRTSDGTDYDFTEHWEHNTDTPETEEGQFLYDITHALHDAHVFNLILTPDYSNHDSHLHVDFSGAHRICGENDDCVVSE